MKSPLRYPGGKSRVADKLVSLFPPHTEYREPFLGGGSVLISERVHNPLKFYWVNDIYNELMSFWICARDHNRELVEIVNKIKAENEDGKALHRKLVGSISSMGKLEKAAAFFVINRISFSGTTLSGGFSKSAFEGRFTDSSIRRVEAIAPILKGVGMTQVDYSELLSAEGDDVFIFMDPPYVKAEKSALYGKNGSTHKGFDHERFAENCRKCQHRWLITYDDCDKVRELFDGYDIQPLQMTYGMRNVGSGNTREQEIIITNYDAEKFSS